MLINNEAQMFVLIAEIRTNDPKQVFFAQLDDAVRTRMFYLRLLSCDANST